MKRPRRNHSPTFADTSKNVTLSYTYNLAGQPMTATASNAAYRNTSARVAAAYATDGLNRLTSTTGTTLVYDALDRLNQVVSGSGTKFLYEGQQIIAEYNGSGALQRRYIPGPGLDNPYVWFEGTGTASSTARWLLGNAFGSIIAVGSTGAANTTLAINQYDEFGVGPTGNLGRFQYKGMAYIPEVGLYHARARTYSQYLGRFMQPDPSGYSDGMNLYSFVHNGPVGDADPLGLGDECTEGHYYESGSGGGPRTNPDGTFVYNPDGSIATAPVYGGHDVYYNVCKTRLPPKDYPDPGGDHGGKPQRDQLEEVTVTATKTFAQKLWQCTADHLGLTALGAGLTAARWPIPGTKPFVTPGSSTGTSLAGKAADQIFEDLRLPVRLPTIVGGLGTGRSLAIAYTSSAARFAGRAVPIVGEALLAYDAYSILSCSFGGDNAGP